MKECLFEEWNTSTHTEIFGRIAELMNYKKVPLRTSRKTSDIIAAILIMFYKMPEIVWCMIQGDIRPLALSGISIGYPANETAVSGSKMGRFRFDLKGLRAVLSAIILLNELEEKFKKGSVGLVLGGDDVYLKMSIASQLAVKYGVDCLYLKGNTDVGVYKYSIRHLNAFPCYERLGKMIIGNNETDEKLIREAEDELKNRISGNRASLMYMPSGKEISDKDSLVKGAVWVFLHDFYDAPGIYNGNIFTSHYEWVVSTVKILKKRGAKIVIKRHPNERQRNRYIIEKLKNKFGVDVVWADEDVYVEDIFKSYCRCIVTVHGSIIPEANYAGIPVICAGRSPYEGFDVAYRAHNLKEYYTLLSKAVSSNGLPAKNRFESVRACSALKKYYASVKKIDVPFDDISEEVWRKCETGNYPDDYYERRNKYLKSNKVKKYVREKIEETDLVDELGIIDMLLRK